MDEETADEPIRGPRALDPALRSWLRRRSFPATGLDEGALRSLREERGTTISVCLPALDEAETVGPICDSVRSRWVDSGFVSELVVLVDPRTTDRTAEAAETAGARVVPSAEVLPAVPGPSGGGGKGEVLWRSLAATTGDLIVWIDADLTDFDTLFVPRLVAPLLEEPTISFVKGHYRRSTDPSGRTAGGGRVTELVARPLLNLFYPELTGFVQPLSGEMAGRRELLTSLPFFTGYGVEIGLLIDVLHSVGLEGMAQVDLVERHHRSRGLAPLGRAAHQIVQVVLFRLQSEGRVKVADDLPTDLVRPVNGDLLHDENPVQELPPITRFLESPR